MQSKILSRLALSGVVLAGFVLSPAFLFSFFPIHSLQGSPAPLIENVFALPKKEQAGTGLPVRLTIPKIKVNAAIERVGLTSQGAVDVPKGPTNVSWFNQSPRPGDIGSAVITGHYGVWKNGIPTVFNNLSKLSKGDKLTIKDEKGIVTTFVVRELRSYGENEKAVDVFRSSDGKAHLNLITCEGIWNKAQKSYSKRLVVFTDKEK